MRSWLKRLGRRKSARALAARLVAGYVRVVRWSGRWTIAGGDIPAAYWERGEPFIMAFWHGRLLMMPYAWRRARSVKLLISQHRDGELLAQAVRGFRFGTIRGSSRRGGLRAVRAMLKSLAAGEHIAITPDGPRGPAMRASEGVVNLARLSGAAILPAAYGARAGWTLASWDRFLLPLPLGGGVILWGEPVRVPRDGDPEAARAELEARLNALTAEADRRCGRRAVVPTVTRPEAVR
ncbi:MAG: DUF374 domain-containing protein [Alphaproteobacteria bacterium]|nr:DUF374 domain-containing protein [Alphaproteobacteria bacterium]